MPTRPLRIDGYDGFRARLGQDLGPSDWFTVTQQDVTGFGVATGDEYWLHMDAERAGRSVYGTTIAHGFFTLSLAPRLLAELIAVDGVVLGVNYGADRLRFPAPMPVGGRVRLHARLLAAERTERGFKTTTRLSFERAGGEAPVCVLDWLGHYTEG